jgi:hypothetical protein
MLAFEFAICCMVSIGNHSLSCGLTYSLGLLFTDILQRYEEFGIIPNILVIIFNIFITG